MFPYCFKKNLKHFLYVSENMYFSPPNVEVISTNIIF